MRAVIVGGGVGGLACAQRLAKRNAGVDVTLVDSRLRHDFAPSFLWVLTGARRPEQISRPLAPLTRSGVELREAEVTGLDLDAAKLATSDGEVEFDQLVLAPGARLVHESVPGLAEAAHGFYLREEAERLREARSRVGACWSLSQRCRSSVRRRHMRRPSLSRTCCVAAASTRGWTSLPPSPSPYR